MGWVKVVAQIGSGKGIFELVAEFNLNGNVQGAIADGGLLGELRSHFGQMIRNPNI